MSRRFALTSILNAAGIGLGFIVGFALTPLMIRTLGKEAYGVWILVTSFSVITGYLSLLDLGFQSAVVKLVAEHFARQEFAQINQVFSAALYLFVGLAVVGAGALILFTQLLLTQVFHIPPALVDTTRIMLYLLAFQTLVEFPGLIFSALLDGVQRYDLQRGIQIGYALIYSAAFVILLSSRCQLLLTLSLTMAMLAIGRILTMAYWAKRLLPTLRLMTNLDRNILRRLTTLSGQFLLVRLNAIVFNSMDKAIIGSMLSTTRLTDYDIANKLRNIAATPLSFITPQIVPTAASLHSASDQKRVRALFLRGTKYQLALCLPITISVLVLAERFINLWIGPEYIYIARLAQLAVSYLLMDALLGVGQNIMFGIGQIKPVLWIVFTCHTIVNLGVSISLTPYIGVEGVMWGTLIGTACSVLPYLKLYLETLGVGWKYFGYTVVWPTYSLAALLAVSLYFSEYFVQPTDLFSLGSLVLVNVAVYGLLFWVLSLDQTERQQALQLLNRRISN